MIFFFLLEPFTVFTDNGAFTILSFRLHKPFFKNKLPITHILLSLSHFAVTTFEQEEVVKITTAR